MKVECPHCGQGLKLPGDVSSLPAVRCPSCNGRFAPGRDVAIRPPVTIYASPVQEPPSLARPSAPLVPVQPATRPCPYCGEAVLAEARKCRYCGEILDAALREAREAKAAARDALIASGRHAPIVVTNNVAASAAAFAGGDGYRRKSLLRSFLAFLFVCFVMIIGGAAVSGKPAPDGTMPPGMIVSGLGAMLLVVGTPIYLIRGVLRVLFG